MMNDFQSLREQIVQEHKEVFEGKAELAMENQERHEALKDLQRSLTELHQVFLDMVVMVVKQGERMDDSEKNVADAGAYIHGGTNALYSAQQMKQRRGRWVCWIGALVLIVLLVCLISILAS
ncbi:Hypothetical predicted protein [Prunus dulcis]|uniref:t-SNARE coiled-coil homology domain-containing protein n=1 Tax=Prunus dulcis TaxID=3755 RepID=A0A5E4FVN4_PRUDU|nr:Hypothetical predicted protein [Prunus dulcis]